MRSIAKAVPPAYLQSMPMEPIPEMTSLSLADVARMVAERRLPPVEQWNPTHCGHSDMRIAADGTWFHQGSPIGRSEMVRLFSTILRREPNGSYVLVTPVEKLDIDVEDAPFVAVELKREGTGREAVLSFRLNVGDLVIADIDHPISLRAKGNGPRPYLSVRNGLEAVIARPVYYELANLAIEEDERPEGTEAVGVWSAGRFFPMDLTPDDLEPRSA